MNARTARLTTNVLGGICGALVLLALAQSAGVGRGYRWLPDAENERGPLVVGAIDKNPFSLPPASTFAEVENRPLFNDDRKPTPPGDAEGPTDTPPPVPLNITLTGVIMTPDVRIALIRENAKNQSYALKVGMPLEGDQAGWTLVEIKPRSATFKSPTDERSEVELQTSAAPAAAAPKATAAAGTPAQPWAAGSPPNGANQDLARRIEDRRRQMREEAERLRNQKKGEQSTPDSKK